MPSADWTSISNGSGAFAIVADATAPSPPDAMQITAGGQLFENITAGPFKDSRISAWVFLINANTSTFYLCLRSQDSTTFIAAPATYFLASINASSATELEIFISAVVNGVITQFINILVTSVNGDPRNSWQQYQFSAFNSGTDMLLRLSQWDGAVFVPMSDCAAPIASFPALDAAGLCRFGGLFGTQNFRIDDVNYYSLT